MEYDTIEVLKAELRFMYSRYEQLCISYGELIKKNALRENNENFEKQIDTNYKKGE